MKKEKEKKVLKITKCKSCGNNLGFNFSHLFPKIKGNLISEMIHQSIDLFNNLCILCVRPYVKGYTDALKVGLGLFCGSVDTLKHTTKRNISLEKRVEELENE